MKNKGITLVSLTITIIVLIILAGISISVGSNMIKKAKLEELKTNMLLIQAKGKEYVEEANFKIGKSTEDTNRIDAVRSEIYVEKAKLTLASDEVKSKINVTGDGFYVLTKDSIDTYNEWGLNKIELENGESYVVKFEEANLKVEVYNTKGYNGKYSLTDIEKIEE